MCFFGMFELVLSEFLEVRQRISSHLKLCSIENMRQLFVYLMAITSKIHVFSTHALWTKCTFVTVRYTYIYSYKGTLSLYMAL